jgi:hypothetical protein
LKVKGIEAVKETKELGELVRELGDGEDGISDTRRRIADQYHFVKSIVVNRGCLKM